MKKKCKFCLKLFSKPYGCSINEFLKKRKKFCSRECKDKSFSVFNVGKKHANWKSYNKLSYSGIHQWLRNYFQKPNKCENPNCQHKSKNFQWALKKRRKCIRKRTNFWQLCRSCHAKYDIKRDTLNKMSLAFRGRAPWNKGKRGLQKHSKATKIKMSISRKNYLKNHSGR